MNTLLRTSSVETAEWGSASDTRIQSANRA